jgi:site-specific DNA-methyltransferase (adenine-specific)
MNKQEFLNGQIVLYNGDCLIIMQDLKDKEIDLVLTDPPYGGAGNDWEDKKNSRFGGLFKKYEIKATRTGETWANKYESKVKHWDIAPEQEIFDGFLGSGTTAIACIRTKRRLIGCELDNEYFDKMCKRIEEELKQGNLF